MKHLHLNTYNSFPESINPQDVPAWLDQKGEAWHSIECCNWEAYSYMPDVAFRMCLTSEGIIINYRVHESTIAALAPADGGKVWEDSCVELFVCPANDGIYYNIECNCAATILVAAGKDRHNRIPAAAKVYQSIQRWSSIGKGTFPERSSNSEWQVVLMIPYSAFFLHNIPTLSGKTFMGNVYKCGDKLTTPHFLSWSPIHTDTPDFHRSEWFGEFCG